MRSDIQQLVQDVDISGLALCQKLKAALDTPGFLEEGGTLAFGCQHAYALNSRFNPPSCIEERLKGADACLFAVAMDLGLSVQVQPIYRKRSYQAG